MAIRNSQPKFVFIIPTLSNVEGLKHVRGLLAKFYPHAQLIVIDNSVNNLGFAKACNDGAKQARRFSPDYLLFLNDDVDFNSDWVTSCIGKMKKNKWAACSPVLMKSATIIENAGYVILPYGRAKLITDLKSSEKIDGLSATALVFEARAFAKLGGFDERFFAYLEDIDLFLRAKKQALRFGVDKQSRVYHQGQVTSSQFKVTKAWLDFRNWIRVINKNWGREEWKKYRWQIFVERLRNLSGIIKAFF